VIQIKVDSSKLMLQFANLTREITEVMAGVIEHEFVQHLYNTPQASGNYVANMTLSTSRAGKQGGEDIFPRPKRNEQPPFARGKLPAIQAAISRNKDFRNKVVAKAGRGAWSGPTIVIYNRMDYAEAVEKGERLRPVNQPGANAMAKLRAALASKFAQPIVYGSQEWLKYRAYRMGI
jgi:hypothetical protein